MSRLIDCIHHKVIIFLYQTSALADGANLARDRTIPRIVQNTTQADSLPDAPIWVAVLADAPFCEAWYADLPSTAPIDISFRYID